MLVKKLEIIYLLYIKLCFLTKTLSLKVDKVIQGQGFDKTHGLNDYSSRSSSVKILYLTVPDESFFTSLVWNSDFLNETYILIPMFM